VNLSGKTIEIGPNVISQEVQLGETLLLDTKTLTYFALTSLGTRIWREMQKSAEVDEVYRHVASNSNISAENLDSAFTAILGGLQRSKLISLT